MSDSIETNRQRRYNALPEIFRQEFDRDVRDEAGKADPEQGFETRLCIYENAKRLADTYKTAEAIDALPAKTLSDQFKDFPESPIGGLGDSETVFAAVKHFAKKLI